MHVIKKHPIHFMPKELFAEYVANSTTWTEISVRCTGEGTCTKVVKMRCKYDNIDTSHLPVGLTWAKGRLLKAKQTYTLEDILVENSPYTSCSALKNRLYKELGWERRCSVCKLDSWMGTVIPIDLDHRNGVHTDNRIENLRLLCPNCHALTDTYKGKNIKIYKDNPITRPLKSIMCACGAAIYKNAAKCAPCHTKSTRKFDWPSYEELMQHVNSRIPMTTIGKMYGVSDNAVRNWIKKYENNKTM